MATGEGIPGPTDRQGSRPAHVRRRPGAAAAPYSRHRCAAGPRPPRRGVDMGPSAVRVAGLEAHLEALGHVVTDGGNISVAIAETKSPGDENARYLKEIRETCVRADIVIKTLEEGTTPFLLGGDHSVAAGSVSGVADSIAAGTRRSASSGSMPTPTSTRRRPRPPATSTACRWRRCSAWVRSRWPTSIGFSPKIAPENTVLIGVRDIDAAERENISRAGMPRSTPCATSTSAACAR